MKIHLRVNSTNPRHTRFTVFMNGANCGTLVMTNEEFEKFRDLLRRGAGDRVDLNASGVI
jgi:hypothetical protein